MAFGTITVKAQNVQPAKAPEATPPPPPSAPLPKGMAEVRIAIAAPTLTEAEDFLCAVYFDLVEATAGTSLSVYTRQFAVVTRLAELKSELETAARKPTGTEIRREREEGEADLGRCSITIGPSASQSAKLDISFTHVAPGAAGTAADAVFVLLNMGDPGMPEVKAAAERSAGNAPLYWILTGFEDTAYLWGGNHAEPLKNAVKSALRQQAGVPCRDGDHVAYAQIYGGVKLAGRNGSDAQFVSHSTSRDFAPTGCHFPVIDAVDSALKQGANNGSPGDLAVRNALKAGFAALESELGGWCEQSQGKGEKTE